MRVCMGCSPAIREPDHEPDHRSPSGRGPAAGQWSAGSCRAGPFPGWRGVEIDRETAELMREPDRRQVGFTHRDPDDRDRVGLALARPGAPLPRGHQRRHLEHPDTGLAPVQRQTGGDATPVMAGALDPRPGSPDAWPTTPPIRTNPARASGSRTTATTRPTWSTTATANVSLCE